MIPGRISRGEFTTIAASTIISPNSDFVRVTDTTVTTSVTTINSPFFGVNGFMVLVNDSGNPINFVSTGNIDMAALRTIPNKFAVPMVFSKVTGKWYVGAIS